MRHGRTDSGDFMPDPRDMTDGEILDALGNLGIEISIDEFKAEALMAGSPEVLSGNWSYMHRVEDLGGESFIYGAVLELWKRHLGYEKRPVEVLAESIDDIIRTYEEVPVEHDHISLLNVYERIKEFYHSLLKEDGSPDVNLYNDLTWHAYHDFEVFLLKSPSEFARHGLIDEAVNIGRWFGDISSQPENFLRDTGCILADAGRREDALRQVEENLRRFPDNVWVVINAGDAVYSLGEKVSAEEFFLKAKGMATTKIDKLGALERLVDLYKEMGETEKADACEAEYRDLSETL